MTALLLLSQAKAVEEAIPVKDGSQASTLNPIDLVLHSSGPVFVVFWLLMLMSVLVWLIAVLKFIQLSRMRGSLHAFERESFNLLDSSSLFELARRYTGSPGGRVVLALARRGGSLKVLESVAKRAIVNEHQRAGGLLTLLSSIAASAPFIGLAGTVYGILDAFLRIGREKSASLPVVAPAIGEALIATLIGLWAAIPALVFYNLLNRRLDDLVSELEAASEAWVTIVAESDTAGAVNAERTIPQGRSASAHPQAYGTNYAGG